MKFIQSYGYRFSENWEQKQWPDAVLLRNCTENFFINKMAGMVFNFSQTLAEFSTNFAQVYLIEFVEFSQNTFIAEHLQTSAFDEGILSCI